MDSLYGSGGKKEGSEVTMGSPGMPTAAAAGRARGNDSRKMVVVEEQAGRGAGDDLGKPDAADLAMSSPGSRTSPGAHGGPGATYPDVLVDLPLSSSTHPAATWNGAAYTDWLTAHLSSSGGPPHHQAVHDGAPYPDADGLIMAQLRSGAAPTAPWNGEAYTDVLTAHLAAPDVSPADWNHGAYPAVAMALDTNALGCVTGEGAADMGLERLRSTGAAAAATERSGGGYCYHHHHSGDMAVPFSAQVVVDEAEDSDRLINVKDSAVAEQEEDLVAAGAAAEPVRGGGLVGVGGELGAAAMTLAVAGLTAGGEVNPSTAVPLFLMLIAGVTLVIVRVARG